MALTYKRRGLSSTAREALYDACRGDDLFPTCNIPGCDQPVRPGERWVESHYPVPHALGGTETGVAHARCNKFYAEHIEVPAIAKAKRGRRKHIGAHVSRYPLPGGRDSHLKRKVGGGVVPRQPRVSRVLLFDAPALDDDPELDAQLDAIAAQMRRPQAVLETLLNGDIDLAQGGSAFEAWLNRIEHLLEGRGGTRFGDALLMCDNAMVAFEEGVSADSYALQLQAMRRAV